MNIAPEPHPQIRAVLEAARKSGVPPWYDMPLAEARSVYVDVARAAGGARVSVEQESEDVISGPEAGVEIPIRIYHPGGEGILPGVVFFHGGGFVLGNLDSHDNLCRVLCRESGAIIISVDYRLAPEHKFPAAVDDCLHAFKWIREHAHKHGIDNTRLAVAGDSAGGNLAAVVSMALRDTGEPMPDYQLFLYPVADLSWDAPSHNEFREGYRLTRSLVEWYYGQYLEDSRDADDFRASPLRAKDFSSLPPTLVLTAGFDPLRDEGRALASKLKDAGNDVEYICFEDMIHGFCNMLGGVERAYEALALSSQKLKKAL